MSTREKVLSMLDDGVSQAEIARRLGLRKSTIAYHARRVFEPDPRFRRRYDWAEVQRFYDAGHNLSECEIEFGFSRETWHSARRRGALITRPSAMPLEMLLVSGRRKTDRRHLVQRLVGAGLKEEKCEGCGLAEWRGARLVIQLHHVNGDGLDNRLENLLLLCPNCHSQTENWGGRNVKRRLRLCPGEEEVRMETRADTPQDQDDESQDDGPAVEELENDPAYNPQEEELEQIKGG